MRIRMHMHMNMKMYTDMHIHKYTHISIRTKSSSLGKLERLIVALSVQEEACQVCPFNNTNSYAGAGNLTGCKCNPGYTGPDGSECVACDAGEYKVSWGPMPCVSCAPGKFNSLSAKTVCDVCPANFFSNSNFSNMSGSTACVACPFSFYSLGNAFNCSRCPADTKAPATLPKGCAEIDDGGAALAAAMAATAAKAVAGAVAAAVAGSVAGGVGGGGAAVISLVEQVVFRIFSYRCVKACLGRLFVRTASYRYSLQQLT